MAVGDVVSDIQSVADDAALEIRPSGSDQWVIHNIIHQDDIEIFYVKGTDELPFAESVGKGVYAYYTFEVNNTVYIKVYNRSGATNLIGYTGRQI